MTIITPTLENVKTCSKCKKSKPRSEFYKSKDRKDGLSYYCKSCDYARRKKYNQSDKGKAAKAREDRRYYLANRDRVKARGFVSMAVYRGTIPPATELDCECCAAPAQEYHHASYLKEHWLTVIPLCKPCHVAIHRKNKTATTAKISANAPRNCLDSTGDV